MRSSRNPSSSRNFSSFEDNRILIEKLISDISSTSEIVQALLAEFQTHSKDFAVLKSQLETINGHVKFLSGIIKDGHENGDEALVTKMALLQEAVREIKEWVASFQQERLSEHSTKERHSHELIVVQKTGKWQFIAALVASGIAVVGTVVSIILGHLLK